MRRKVRVDNRLAAWRTYRGYTQIDIAMRMGVHPATVSHWEAGLSVPRPAHAARLARILRCSESDLFPSQVG